MESSMVDIMIENEQKNAADRIQSLEQRVQQQNDELICLKSALADIIRRMQLVENLQQQQQQQIYTQISHSIHKQNIPVNKSINVKKTNKEFDTRSLGSSSIAESLQMVNSHKETSRVSMTRNESRQSALPQNKLSSSFNSSEKLAQQSKTKALQQFGDFTFNSDSGLIKFFIRGRPITLYLPSNQISTNSSEIGFNFDIENKIKIPKQQLKLEWAYGYRGKDCRSNLYQLPTGEIIYCIAGVVVLYNVEERIQRFYLGHTDDVKALAIHPDKITIATGQTAGHDKQEGKAHVRIWDSLNLTTLKIIGLNGSNTEFSNSICCLSFSKADGGHQLAIVDDGNEKWLSVWNWQNNTKTSSVKCYGDLVFSAEFSPTEKNLIVTCGKQHIAFWTLEAQHITKKMGLFESSTAASSNFKVEKPKYILCLSFTSNGEVISGDSEGNIIFWNHKECKINRIIKEAHEGSIFSILYVQNQQNLNGTASSSSFSSISMITGGGKNGRLIEWNQDYQKTGRILQIPENNGMCRVISQGKGNNLLLVGTTKNCVFQANFDLNYLNCIVNGHDGELWGLVACRESHFLTCGNDKNLLYWDSLSHSQISSSQFEDPLHCVNIHPTLDLAVIGLSNKPKWIIFDLNERKIIYNQIEGTEQIQCIAFSPNGAYLACGSRDNFIYIYSVTNDGLKYSRIGRCSGHSSFITHLDWSVDSEYLMSNSGDYEILTWHAHSCKQVTQVNQLRDLVFQTNTCILSLNTLGIWTSSGTQSYDGTDINACSSSIKNKLCCCVDDMGKVNLFTYPCNATKAEKRVYQGHSSHVTNVTFINDDTRVITTGGNDMAILQWSIINE